MLGTSTFGLSMWLVRLLPVCLADWLLLAGSWLTIGNTDRFGIERPKLGPIELKTKFGKTPVLDVGTLHKIKNGYIKVQHLIAIVSTCLLTTIGTTHRCIAYEFEHACTHTHTKGKNHLFDKG